ncbi:dihydroxyacetone kinase subunit DhaK, partial [Burkholderia pseudomallei]
QRSAPMPADALADPLVAANGDAQSSPRGARVAQLVNGLGATPDMELGIELRAEYDSQSRRGVEVARAGAGTFLSALDMP